MYMLYVRYIMSPYVYALYIQHIHIHIRCVMYVLYMRDMRVSSICAYALFACMRYMRVCFICVYDRLSVQRAQLERLVLLDLAVPHAVLHRDVIG